MQLSNATINQREFKDKKKIFCQIRNNLLDYKKKVDLHFGIGCSGESQ